MPLQGSGNPISMRDIKDEFGPNPGNNIGPVSMEDYRLQEEDIDGLTNLPLDENAGPSNNTDIPTSGSMSFENFYNAKLNVVVRMTSQPGNNPSNQNARNIYNGNTNESVVRCVGGLRTRPDAGNMGGRRVIIDVNKQISGGENPSNKNTNRQQCAMRTGEWATGTKLTVHIGSSGSIYGAGGNGGRGDSVKGEAEDGRTGTSALGIDFGTSSNPTQIINKGYIQAGYGGGGGGGGVMEDPSKNGETDSFIFGGGGGGGAGIPGGEGATSNEGKDSGKGSEFDTAESDFPGGDGSAQSGGAGGDNQEALHGNAESGFGGRGCDPQEPVDEGETTEGHTATNGEENGTPGEAGTPGYSIIVEGASNTVNITESGSGAIAEENARIIYSTNVVSS